MQKLGGFVSIVFIILSFVGNAYAVTLFYEDFDSIGLGIESWTSTSRTSEIYWDEFNPDNGDPQNLASGTGNYASLRNYDTFGRYDEEYTLISPLIDVSAYQGLSLSFDMYFYDDGLPEDYFYITANGVQIDYMYAGNYSPSDYSTVWNVPISGNQSYDLSFLEEESVIELAFTWWSSSEPPGIGDIQIDSIMISGTPVPEPSTFLLLGSGLAGLVWFRRRK